MTTPTAADQAYQNILKDVDVFARISALNVGESETFTDTGFVTRTALDTFAWGDNGENFEGTENQVYNIVLEEQDR